MKRNVMGIASGLVILLGLGLMGSSIVEAGSVGKSTITGKVTNTSGQIITSAKVVVEVVASLSSQPFEPSSAASPRPQGFWGQHRFVITNSQGSYSATVDIPDRIRPQRLYARVVVAKLGGTPIYAMQARLMSLDPPPPLGGTKVYPADFVLSPVQLGSVVGYGAFVQGTIRDAETDERFRGAGAIFQNGIPGGFLLLTDAEGYYFGVVPLSSSTQTMSYQIVGEANGRVGMLPNGIVYEPAQKTITFQSGQTYTLDAELQRSPTQTAIVGRVIDRSTGQPIPKALVRLVGIDNIAGGSLEESFVTDIFGYYQLRVPRNASPVDLRLNTRGAYVEYFDSLEPSPYAGQQLTPIYVPMGTTLQHDFLLDPCYRQPIQVCYE